MKIRTLIASLSMAFAALGAQGQEPSFESRFPVVPGRWSVEKVNEWYDRQPWLVGANYYPATAINQIEMWQASTWDPERIDLELGWTEELGFNTLRVYLHDLVWASDEEGLYRRMDQFLDICQKHGIRPSFVFFDDCHFPEPRLGEQPKPVRAYHNSGWVNCPARDVAMRYAKGTATEQEKARLKGYVQHTLRRFDDDDRVLYWELYNEHGRGNGETGDMRRADGSPLSIGELSNRLVYDAWVWAREIAPSQPITSNSLGSVGKNNLRINRENSDIHSVHAYNKPGKTEEIIREYQSDGRPVIITEWLARPLGSTVAECLPLMKKYKVGAIQWGLVLGKSQTNWPWSSRMEADGKTKRNLQKERREGNVVRPGEAYPEPDVWFHDLLRTDGTPYDPAETAIFKQLTGKTK